MRNFSFPPAGSFGPVFLTPTITSTEYSMQFLRRFYVSKTESTRDRRPATRRRSQVVLETLESRNLMSVAGVALQYGALAITAPLASKNVTTVSIDPSNKDVKVTLNGNSEEFSPKLVGTITYIGGSGGDDTFTNDTSLMTLSYAYGSGNDFTGGTGYNYVFFFGADNTYNAQSGSFSDVFEVEGKDTVNHANGATLQIYT
jgi:hypothetical protein